MKWYGKYLPAFRPDISRPHRSKHLARRVSESWGALQQELWRIKHLMWANDFNRKSIWGLFVGNRGKAAIYWTHPSSSRWQKGAFQGFPVPTPLNSSFLKWSLFSVNLPTNQLLSAFWEKKAARYQFRLFGLNACRNPVTLFNNSKAVFLGENKFAFIKYQQLNQRAASFNFASSPI